MPLIDIKRIGVIDARNATSIPYVNTNTGTVTFDFKTVAASQTGATGTYVGMLTFQKYQDSSGGKTQQLAFTDANDIYTRVNADSTTWNEWEKLWHTGNDGATSGLDADLLDGKQGAEYVISVSSQNLKLWQGTLAAYNAITTKDANTLYFVV